MDSVLKIWENSWVEKLTINNQLGIIMGDYKLLKQNQIIKEMIG